jgi:hypothetical protein
MCRWVTRLYRALSRRGTSRDESCGSREGGHVRRFGSVNRTRVVKRTERADSWDALGVTAALRWRDRCLRLLTTVLRPPRGYELYQC